jgi:hypothetical protein
MDSSKAFLNSLFWVASAAIFATGATFYHFWADRDNNGTAVVHQEAPIAIQQR